MFKLSSRSSSSAQDKARREDVCMILDIGNGSVGGSYVRFRSGEKPEMVYSVRMPIHIPEKPSSAHLFSKMTKLLEAVADNLAKEGARHHEFKKLAYKDVKHVFCILSSPWYVSKTKIYRIERGEPRPLSEKFVQDLLDREAEELEGSFEKERRADLDLIEQKVIRTKLNGYETKYPYGQAARQVELGAFMSFSPAVVVEKIRKIVAKRFNASHIVFHSFALMSYSIIEDLFKDVPSYLFLDITGEVTEITVVRRNLISEALSIPYGRNFLLREVAKRYKVTPDIAATYMKLYNAGNADRKLREGVAKAIAAAEEDWAAALDKALKEIGRDKILPPRIFATVDDDVAPAFTKFLNDRRHYRNGEPEPFNVTILNKNILAHFCSYGRSGMEDAFLAIESLYFNKVFHS